jgi:hypothetical protein
VVGEEGTGGADIVDVDQLARRRLADLERVRDSARRHAAKIMMAQRAGQLPMTQDRLQPLQGGHRHQEDGMIINFPDGGSWRRGFS